MKIEDEISATIALLSKDVSTDCKTFNPSSLVLFLSLLLLKPYYDMMSQCDECTIVLLVQGEIISFVIYRLF